MGRQEILAWAATRKPSVRTLVRLTRDLRSPRFGDGMSPTRSPMPRSREITGSPPCDLFASGGGPAVAAVVVVRTRFGRPTPLGRALTVRLGLATVSRDGVSCEASGWKRDPVSEEALEALSALIAGCANDAGVPQ
jgi:hypothetical protein